MHLETDSCHFWMWSCGIAFLVFFQDMMFSFTGKSFLGVVLGWNLLAKSWLVFSWSFSVIQESTFACSNCSSIVGVSCSVITDMDVFWRQVRRGWCCCWVHDECRFVDKSVGCSSFILGLHVAQKTLECADCALYFSLVLGDVSLGMFHALMHDADACFFEKLQWTTIWRCYGPVHLKLLWHAA